MMNPSLANNAATKEDVFGHPLTAIPALGRIPKSVLRDVVYTFLLTIPFTAIFSLIGLLNAPETPLPYLVIGTWTVSLCVGYSMHLFAVLVAHAILRWYPDIKPGPRTVIGIFTAMLGGLGGYWLGAYLTGVSVWSGTTIFSMWVGVSITTMTIAQRRIMLSEIAVERERTARIEAERLMMVSRLQMLQAQIEPHFLFNTLANVSSLIEVEPKRARKMLDEFTLLLRAGLDSTRKSTTTLRQELQTVEAYLSVLKVRMGDRLTYRVTTAPELVSIGVPAMLLQPIVENAVKHGIEPRVCGGTVSVEVQRDGGALVFAISDDGVGFTPNAKENVGLGAVRERLAVQYNGAASLNIERTPDHKTVVTISIPFPDGAAA